MAKETYKIENIISEGMLKELKDNTTEDSNENEENVTPDNEELEENTNNAENPNKQQTIRKALKIVGKLVLTGLITAGTAISIATGLSALAAGGLTAIAFAINSTTNIAQIGEKLIDIIKESLSKKQLANIELEPAL